MLLVIPLQAHPWYSYTFQVVSTCAADLFPLMSGQSSVSQEQKIKFGLRPILGIEFYIATRFH